MEEEKNKGGYFYYYLLALVIIASGVWLFWGGNEEDALPQEAGQEVIQKEIAGGEANVRVGVLKSSDNPARGNLMLTAEGQDTIYIQTARDFTSLLGKEVEVSTESAEGGFKLLDIKAK